MSILAERTRPTGARLWRAEDVPAELAERWGREAASWFGPDRRAVPGAEDRAHLALVETELGELVAKAHRPRGWKRSLVRLGAREPRALRAMRAARLLRRHDLPTPEALAAMRLADRAGGLEVLLTRRLDAVDPWSAVERSVASLDEVLEALARALARLHGAGFRHRDLKATNILVRAGEDGPRIAWIDLDGLGRPSAPRDALRLRDLARLCASFESARARAVGVRAPSWRGFLERYLDASAREALAPIDANLALARTQGWARRHVVRNLARRRPIV